jgi:hypothetical protein
LTNRKNGNSSTKALSGVLFVLGLLVAVSLGASGGASAASTPTFNQTINPGVLSTDILDASRVPVASPSVAMTTKSFLFACGSGANASTGTFGSSSQRIYVIDPAGANNGWTLTMAATGGATALWSDGGTNTYDFNDATTGGCTDGADTDTKIGQLTVDPSVSTLTTDCTSCTTASITKGSSSAFVETSQNNITLLSAAAAADDVWRGYLTGVTLSQTIPAEQPAASYTINMTLTATAL